MLAAASNLLAALVRLSPAEMATLVLTGARWELVLRWLTPAHHWSAYLSEQREIAASRAQPEAVAAAEAAGPCSALDEPSAPSEATQAEPAPCLVHASHWVDNCLPEVHRAREALLRAIRTLLVTSEAFAAAAAAAQLRSDGRQPLCAQLWGALMGRSALAHTLAGAMSASVQAPLASLGAAPAGEAEAEASERVRGAAGAGGLVPAGSAGGTGAASNPNLLVSALAAMAPFCAPGREEHGGEEEEGEEEGEVAQEEEARLGEAGGADPSAPSLIVPRVAPSSRLPPPTHSAAPCDAYLDARAAAGGGAPAEAAACSHAASLEAVQLLQLLLDRGDAAARAPLLGCTLALPGGGGAVPFSLELAPLLASASPTSLRLATCDLLANLLHEATPADGAPLDETLPDSLIADAQAPAHTGAALAEPLLALFLEAAEHSPMTLPRISAALRSLVGVSRSAKVQLLRAGFLPSLLGRIDDLRSLTCLPRPEAIHTNAAGERGGGSPGPYGAYGGIHAAGATSAVAAAAAASAAPGTGGGMPRPELLSQLLGALSLLGNLLTRCAPRRRAPLPQPLPQPLTRLWPAHASLHPAHSAPLSRRGRCEEAKLTCVSLQLPLLLLRLWALSAGHSAGSVALRTALLGLICNYSAHCAAAKASLSAYSDAKGRCVATLLIRLVTRAPRVGQPPIAEAHWSLAWAGLGSLATYVESRAVLLRSGLMARAVPALQRVLGSSDERRAAPVRPTPHPHPHPHPHPNANPNPDPPTSAAPRRCARRAPAPHAPREPLLTWARLPSDGRCSTSSPTSASTPRARSRCSRPTTPSSSSSRGSSAATAPRARRRPSRCATSPSPPTARRHSSASRGPCPPCCAPCRPPTAAPTSASPRAPRPRSGRCSAGARRPRLCCAHRTTSRSCARPSTR